MSYFRVLSSLFIDFTPIKKLKSSKFPLQYLKLSPQIIHNQRLPRPVSSSWIGKSFPHHARDAHLAL